MVSSNDRFGQARLKHVWANQRIHEAQAHWQGFLETDFCELVVEDHPVKPEQVLRIKSIKSVPGELVLTLGDAIHNLKSALDYAISEILGWQDKRLTFPMGESREELIASFRADGLDPCSHCGRGGKGKGRNAAIEMAVPGIGNFIVDHIRPYKAANGFLWPLNKLDVRDKHRLLVPVLVPQTIAGINAIDGNQNRVINGTGTVGAGGVINFFRTDSGGLKIQSYGKATAEILFNETGIIENARVFPTLVNMSQAVAQTIGRIEEFAVGVGWPNRS